MDKIHANSDGYKSKYFYFKKKDLDKKKLKLYYASDKSKKDDGDDYCNFNVI